MVHQETVRRTLPTRPAGDAAVMELTPNERRLLQLLRQDPDLTRAGLTQDIGLTAQSVSRILASLEEHGLVTTGSRVLSGTRGKPSTRLHLNCRSVFGVGLSVMTDAVSGAVLDLGGHVVAEDDCRLQSVDLDAVIGDCQMLYARLCARAGIRQEQVVGVGVGVTGYFIGKGRQFNPPDPLDSLALIDFDRLLAEALDRRVWLENDGSVAAVGEALAGQGSRYPSFAYLYLAMGIGGGVILDGKLLDGDFGNAGEFGGVVPPEKFGDRPSLELLRQMLAERGQQHATISDMLRAFDVTAPGVEEWIARTSPVLNLICSSIVAVIDPGAIVLGGRLPRSLADRLAGEVNFYSVPRRGVARPFPPVMSSSVVGDAAAIGAAALPLKERIFA